MKVTAVLPIRKGSKSIPDKNIRTFAGRPLFHWQLLALLGCKKIDEVWILTDYELNHPAFNIKHDKLFFFERSAEVSTDDSSTEDTVLEFTKTISTDLLIIAQATNPFVTNKDYCEAIETFRNNHCSSLLSVSKTKRFFWNITGKPLNYDFHKRPRRQNFESYIYVENGAFYIVKGVMFRNFQNRLVYPVEMYIMPEYTSIEIDEEYDWELAEKVFKEEHLPLL
jgi:N-acylneuraminate cytidylyltransferase